MVSVLEAIRLKNGIVPCGNNFDPTGSSLTWHMRRTRVHLPCKFQVSATFHSKKVFSAYGFAKGSRGGTWHVPRGTWRHVTNAIVVPALWRIEWCLSGPDRLRRSGAINESPWTDRHTHSQTNTIRPMSISIPSGVNLRSSEWTSSILRHYDFGLEAICFEPLVSRSLVSFSNEFRVIMFIEAGDVTHRRRGQNRNEGLSKNFQVFYTENFFDPNLFILT